MRRHFVQLEPDGTAKAEVWSERVPGSGPDLPADFVEVTSEPGHETTRYAGFKKRVGGAWEDLPPPPAPPPTPTEVTLARIEVTLARLEAIVSARPA